MLIHTHISHITHIWIVALNPIYAVKHIPHKNPRRPQLLFTEIWPTKYWPQETQTWMEELLKVFRVLVSKISSPSQLVEECDLLAVSIIASSKCDEERSWGNGRWVKWGNGGPTQTCERMDLPRKSFVNPTDYHGVVGYGWRLGCT